MAIGFATVTTTLLINGRTLLRVNEADFIVYYSDAYVNGNQDLSVITDTNKIVFNTTLNLIGQKYVLDYDVTNGSKLYDADVEMVCTGGNDYLSVNNEFDDEEDLLTLATRRGTLTLEMIRSNAGDDIPVSIECTIVAKAVEKDEVVEEESPAEIFCKQLGYSYGMLAPTTYNDILEDPDHGEGSTETYCCSNDPDFNEYDGYDEDFDALISLLSYPSTHYAGVGINLHLWLLWLVCCTRNKA